MTRTMTLLLISLGVFHALVTVASEDEPCKDGKVSACGSKCPPTCDNLNPACDKECARGCFCPEGTVENSWGECVEKEKCASCSGNTTFSNCANNCPGVVSPPQCERTPCKKGCACKPTFALIANTNTCVLPQDLPEQGSKK